MAKSQVIRGKKRSSKQKLDSAEKNKALWRFIEILPIALPVALAAFGVIALSLVLLGQFRTWFIWPLGLAASFGAILLVYKFGGGVERPGGLKERRWCDVLIIVGVLAWIGLSVGYTSQHVFTDRDPSAYAVAGAWLSNNDSLEIPKPAAFGDVQGTHTYSAAFYDSVVDEGNLEGHGTHLLPALLGSAGKILGDIDMLRVAPLFGAVALLAMYSYGRLLVRPRWALVATIAMGVAMPMLYFSRDTYTEPLMMAFLFGGLALLWQAQASRSKMLWALSGLMFGATTLSRIDAWLAVILLSVFLIAFLALQKERDRRHAILYVGLLAASFALVAFVGFLDLWEYSSVYYKSKHEVLLSLVYVTIAVWVVGSIGVWLCWRTRVLRVLSFINKKQLAYVVAILVVAASIVLISRPMWQESMRAVPENITGIDAIQARTGDPVEPRLYSEHTVEWLGWYIGPVAVMLGFAGMAYVSARIIRKRDMLALAGMLVIGGVSLIYLIKPRITPDQIWAVRRFLPVAIPGLLIYGMVAVDYLYRKIFEGKPFDKVLAFLIGAFIVIVPLTASWPLMGMRDTAQLHTVQNVCETLPERSAVVWFGLSRLEAIMPTRAYCQVPAVGFTDKNKEDPDKPNQTHLIEIYNKLKEENLTPIIGVYETNLRLVKDQIKGPKTDLPWINKNHKELEDTVRFAPHIMVDHENRIFLGKIMPDGKIVPLKRQQD